MSPRLRRGEGRMYKNAICQHLSAAEGAFGKPFMVQMGSFWPLFAVLWFQKVPKTAVHPPPKKNQPKMRQNHPKMGFEGILDRLEAISTPSVSISKGIKNKNFYRFWAIRCLPLSPNWLATCPLLGWQRVRPPLKAKLPPFWGETTPLWGATAILGRNYPL